MDEDRLNEIEEWVDLADRNHRNAGVRLPTGMARELVDEVRRLQGIANNTNTNNERD